jgi:hypothetical protein
MMSCLGITALWDGIPGESRCLVREEPLSRLGKLPPPSCACDAQATLSVASSVPYVSNGYVSVERVKKPGEHPTNSLGSEPAIHQFTGDWRTTYAEAVASPSDTQHAGQREVRHASSHIGASIPRNTKFRTFKALRLRIRAYCIWHRRACIGARKHGPAKAPACCRIEP